MKRILSAVAAIALTAGAAHAQARPFSIGVAAGVSLPTGDLSDAVNTGFNLAASVGYKPTMVPFGIRVEGAWDQWNFKDDASVDGHFRSLSLTGNAVLDIPVSTPVKPYIIGGIGLYHINASASASTGGSTTTVTSDAENKFGFNVGGGVRMPLGQLDTYVEARFHAVTGLDSGNFRFIPITFGIRF